MAAFRELVYDSDVISSNLMTSFRNPTTNNFIISVTIIVSATLSVKSAYEQLKFYRMLFIIFFICVINCYS